MGPNGRQIFFLAQGFGMNGPPLGSDGNKIVIQLAQALFFPAASQTDAVTDGLFFQRRMVLQQCRHSVHCMDRGRDILGFATEFQRRSAAYRGDVKCIFQHADVLIAAAKNCSGQLNAVQIDPFFQQSYHS